MTWGDASKEFPAEELAKGINLAAEFLDNPFSEAFRKVEEKIAEQQGMEVDLVKSLMHNLPEYERAAPGRAARVGPDCRRDCEEGQGRPRRFGRRSRAGASTRSRSRQCDRAAALTAAGLAG